jgi:hypothetical protein
MKTQANLLWLNILLLIGLLAISTVAVAQHAVNLMNFGSVLVPALEIEVYRDVNCTTLCTYVNWGTLEPNSSASQIVYVKNVGGRTVTLSLNVSEWRPSQAESQLSLSWDYDNRSLVPDFVLPVIFTLSVDEFSTVTDFNFKIHIYVNWSE